MSPLHSLLLARGRDRLETRLAPDLQGGERILLLARGCDLLKTLCSVRHFLIRRMVSYLLGDAIDWKPSKELEKILVSSDSPTR